MAHTSWQMNPSLAWISEQKNLNRYPGYLCNFQIFLLCLSWQAGKEGRRIFSHTTSSTWYSTPYIVPDLACPEVSFLFSGNYLLTRQSMTWRIYSIPRRLP